ncbi:hypothetical protein AHAS_Ahas02G0089700 [Arachis hypogaea]
MLSYRQFYYPNEICTYGSLRAPPCKYNRKKRRSSQRRIPLPNPLSHSESLKRAKGENVAPQPSPSHRTVAGSSASASSCAFTVVTSSVPPSASVASVRVTSTLRLHCVTSPVCASRWLASLPAVKASTFLMHKEALSLFHQYIKGYADFKPDHSVVASILKSCSALLALKLGTALHGYVVKQGHGACQVTNKALLNMVHEVQFSSDEDVSDNAPNGEAKPNAVTVAIVLPVCARLGDVDAGRSVHAYVIKSGFEADTLAGNALMSMYAKCGLVSHDAYAVFDNIGHKDVVSWNAMIAGLAENLLFEDAFTLFSSMVKGPTQPNYATTANILPVCALLGENVAYQYGRQIHSYVLQRAELSADVSVSNALISFYIRVGWMMEAESLFWAMDARDLVSWNAIIAGFTSNGQWFKALNLLSNLVSREMLLPDSVTIVSILPLCAQFRNLQVGKQIHAYIFRHHYLFEDTTVGNALVSFYAKCGNTEKAYHTFNMIPRKDLISWNSILDAFGEKRHHSRFLSLLHTMLKLGIRPDSVTVLATIHFCASLLRVEKVKEIHTYSIKAGFLVSDTAPAVGNAILDAYAKCGNMDYANRMFQNLSEKRNLVSCNSMISGYVGLGSHRDANMIFSGMSETDLTTWNLMV